MKHEVTIERKTLEAHRAEERSTKQAVCTCGWEGQLRRGDAEGYPGTEVLAESNGHKLDVLLELAQHEKPDVQMAGQLQVMEFQWGLHAHVMREMATTFSPAIKPDLADDGPEVGIIKAIRATHQPDELVMETCLFLGHRMAEKYRRWFRTLSVLHGPYR